MDLGLAGAAAVVVGGSRGMGLASARCLAGDGARVAVIGRSRSDLDAAVGELARCGSPDPLGLVAAVRDSEQDHDADDEVARRRNGEQNAQVNTDGPNEQGRVDIQTDE
uniref:SDR family NAD(P)-dependent oxidoreductase n=1 Tax=Nocardia wallacei TaxID=480035 RepID=UPI0024563868